jgi:N-acetyl-gamma-glutamyl-phosphate reductase
VSGAGREPALGTLFPEVSENFRAYKTVGHQHTAEMLQELEILAGKKLMVSFTPHLAPMNRGINSTIYLKVKGSLPLSEIEELYRGFCREEAFLRFRGEGDPPQTLDVRGTNFCDLFVCQDKEAGLLKVISVIDNLARGAGTQAMVNLNLMTGESETLGVSMAALRP